MIRHQTTPALPATGRRVRSVVALWRRRMEGRRALAALTDRELRDIGISPGEAIAEAGKPFWAA